MRVLMWCFALVLLVVAPVLAPVTVFAQPPVENGPRPFGDKLLAISTKSGQVGMLNLTNVSNDVIAGKSYLKGVGADVFQSAQSGKMVWVAVDDISSITVYDTLEDLRKAVTLFQADWNLTSDAEKPRKPSRTE